MFSVSQAALRLGVCVRTLHRWDKTGKLHCTRTVGGHRRISLSEVNRLLGRFHRRLLDTPPRRKRCAVYARVSGHRQKTDGDLDRQLQALSHACKNRFRTSPLVISDIGSGLNLRRKGLVRLLRLAKEGVIHTVLLTHKDRLARFGVSLLERILADYGVKVIVLYQDEHRTPQEELVDDMMALLASFSGRVYGLRARQHSKSTAPQT